MKTSFFLQHMKNLSFNKACIIISLICLLFPQESFSQDILGKWKCPDEMYQYWGYKAGKAHITFKKDNIFILKVKGRDMMGHKFWPHRRFDVKVKGFYMEKNDSMYFYVEPQNIKCHVLGGKEDPVMSPERDNYRNPTRFPAIARRKIDDYEYYQEQNWLWDGRQVMYDSELRVCEFQRIAMINQMLDFFELKRYSFKEISQDSLRLGKKFIITRD